MTEKETYIADTIHGNICMTPLEKRIISHVTFNRMHDIYQNSTVYLTFPCNRTKRFEHSLGTMKLCSDIFYHSVGNASQKTIKKFTDSYKCQLLQILANIKNADFNKYNEKLGGIIKKINTKELPILSKNKWVTFNCPTNIIKYENVYTILLQSVRAAALLHDIGHPPYSHIVEFALSNVYNGEIRNTSHSQRSDAFIKIMSPFFESKHKLHEQMGNKIASIILGDIINNIDEDQAANNEIYQYQIYQILVKETVEKIMCDAPLFCDLHKIIDCTLDGDRLDYVTRDARNSGLDTGKIEYDRLITTMKLIYYKEKYIFCPNIKSLNTIEDFLQRRWSIYKNVIFHHRVIKTDYLLGKTVEKISKAYLDGKINKDCEEDDQTGLLPSNISGLWKALINSTPTEQSNALSQWDDSWLITILKKHYFRDFKNSEDIILTKQLSELLTNKKYYFPAIKRLEDFLVIDNAMSKRFREDKALQKLIQKLDNKTKDINSEFTERKDIISAQPTVDVIKHVFDMANCDNVGISGLVFAYIKKNYNILYSKQSTVNLIDFLNEIVSEAKDQTFTNSETDDIFVVVKPYDIGTSKPLYLYNSNDSVVSITKISSITHILQLYYNTFPQFFIFILKNKKYLDENIDISKFLINVGIFIADKFINDWQDTLSRLNMD